MRKIVQVTSHREPWYSDNPNLFALCDDGSLWRGFGYDDPESTWNWSLIPNVPQGPIPATIVNLAIDPGDCDMKLGVD